MFSLRDQIGGDEPRVTAFTHNHNFRWAGKKINAAIKGHQLLCRGYKEISRANDLIDLGNRLGSIRQRGNGLRSADAVKFPHAKKMCGRQSFNGRARRNHANLR